MHIKVCVCVSEDIKLGSKHSLCEKLLTTIQLPEQGSNAHDDVMPENIHIAYNQSITRQIQGIKYGFL